MNLQKSPGRQEQQPNGQITRSSAPKSHRRAGLLEMTLFCCPAVGSTSCTPAQPAATSTTSQEAAGLQPPLPHHKFSGVSVSLKFTPMAKWQIPSVCLNFKEVIRASSRHLNLPHWEIGSCSPDESSQRSPKTGEMLSCWPKRGDHNDKYLVLRKQNIGGKLITTMQANVCLRARARLGRRGWAGRKVSPIFLLLL